MRFHIHRKGFDRVTGMAWLLCFSQDDDSGRECSTSRSTFLLSRTSPDVIVRPGYDPPQIFKRTPEGWVAHVNEFEVGRLGERVWYTSRNSYLVGEDEELDYLHVALISVLPDSFLISFHRHWVTVRSQIYRALKILVSKMQINPNQEQRKRWELCHAVVKHLGRGWQVDASALQIGGEYRGKASGPDGMTLSFIARTVNLDPIMEAICPPLGWLRVDGRLPYNDGGPFAKLSIELQESQPPEEIANEIIVRLLPVYRDFLEVMAKYHPQDQPIE
jgi:hypothetical protein